jgi:hypothetical protein
MSRSANKEIKTSNSVTSWTQEGEASNALYFDSLLSLLENIYIPNVKDIAVNMFLFKPSYFRVSIFIAHTLHIN